MYTWASSMVTQRNADLAKGGSSDGTGGELGVDLLPGPPQLLLNHFHGHLAVKAGHLHGPCVSPHGAAYPQLQGGWAMPDTALGSPREIRFLEALPCDLILMLLNQRSPCWQLLYVTCNRQLKHV